MEKSSPLQYDYSLLKTCGTNVFISTNVEIRRPHLVSIGNNVAIDSGFYLTTQASIEDYVHIAPYTTVIGGSEGLLIMEHFSGMAAGTRIICGSEKYFGEGLVGPLIPDEFKDELNIAPVIFKMFATSGTNVVVLPGVTIGEGSVIAACSLVTKDTEPWTFYRGIPAKPVVKRKKDKMIEYAKKLGYL